MDLLWSGNLDGFAIVSSDSDFTRLATRLRESGKTVIGLGRRRTPASLVAACDRLIYLEVLGSGDRGQPESEPEDEAAAPLPDLRRILVTAINSTSAEDGWATLSAVGSHISRNDPSFDPRNYGYPKLVELARAQDYVDVEQAAGSAVRVRLRSARPRKSPVKRSTKKTAAKKS
jgi:hypothetical protein